MNRLRRSVVLRSMLALMVTPFQLTSATTFSQKSFSPPCNQQLALSLVQQQIAEAKTFSAPTSRISILTRAAGVLWDDQQDTARELFLEAYDLATLHSQQKDSPDQRYTVIQAIAKHDAEWARRLVERVAAPQREAENPETPTPGDSREGDRLRGVAASLLFINQREAAISVVKSSFRYPASYLLARFLYQLAESDQEAADGLYVEALNAYANAPVSEFLFLSSYPYALPRVAGPKSLSTYFTIPRKFVPNAEAQNLFLQVVFRRAKSLLEPTAQSVGNAPLALEAAQIYLALDNLDPVIARRQPTHYRRAMVVRDLLNSRLSSEARLQVENLQQQQKPGVRSSFENLIEKSEREKNPGARDRFIAQAILVAPMTERLERLEAYIQKVGDSNVRQQLSNWLYFKRTQEAIKDGRLDEAAQIAQKVQGLDLRAYLSFESAAESIRRLNDHGRAIEELEKSLGAALRAPDTTEKARAMLGIAHVYAKLDYVRSLQVMSDAIKTINKLSAIDLTSTTIFQRIEGRNFSIEAAYQVAGFSLENVLREISPHDFQGTLSLAEGLEDRFHRARAILALSAQCVEKQEEKKPHTVIH